MSRFDIALNKKVENPSSQNPSLLKRVGKFLRNKTDEALDPQQGFRADSGASVAPSPSSVIPLSVPFPMANPGFVTPSEIRGTTLAALLYNNLNNRGPTSRHVVISFPDGHRTIIPLRRLMYSITDNENNTCNLTIVISNREKGDIEQDIRRGRERDNEVQRNIRG